MLALGLMSGTSLDGVDVVLCELNGNFPDIDVKVVDALVHPYPKRLFQRVKRIVDQEALSIGFVSSVNVELGHWYADACERLLKRNALSGADLRFVANHGQTLYHQPQADDEQVASTLQMGESAVLAYRLGVDVIDNFRVADVAAKGQGAPLVPFSELILYRDLPHPYVLLNLGGIANLSYFDQDQRLAFDCGPANMMINAAMQHFFQKPYDDQGQIAAQGRLVPEMMNALMEHPFIKLSPPKSTGREAFGQVYVDHMIERFPNVSGTDVVATFTSFSAASVEAAMKLLPQPPQMVVVGGGGAHNQTLMRELTQRLAPAQVLTQEALGYSSDLKEAVAFVILGYAFIQGVPSNLKDVTGASHDVILGKLTPKPYAKRNF
jgi:anhydro-N-acetylmuramic acid kinase